MDSGLRRNDECYRSNICISIGAPSRLGEPSNFSSAWVTQRSGPSCVTITSSTLPSPAAPRWIRLSIETPASRIAAVISASIDSDE